MQIVAALTAKPRQLLKAKSCAFENAAECGMVRHWMCWQLTLRIHIQHANFVKDGRTADNAPLVVHMHI